LENQFRFSCCADQAGSYGIDMAMRLKRPEVSQYQEIYLFVDPEFTKWSFRSLAKTVKWRPFDNQMHGDINYSLKATLPRPVGK